MFLYEPINLPQIPFTLSPHIKTYTRLLNNNYLRSYDASSSTIQNDIDGFGWIMLTSACLSRGAQGYANKMNVGCEYTGERSYLNFELGVLFVSRLQGYPDSDRLYSSYSNSCSCCKDNGDRRIIKMPIPFNMRPQPYQIDPDEPEFSETPYFHMMSRNSLISGPCSLTPFGNWFLNQGKNKDLNKDFKNNM